MRALLALPLLALLLAGCEKEIPTPETLNLPDPDSILLASPSDMPDVQLCAFAARAEVAVKEWEAYLNRWTAALGREPVSVAVTVERLAGKSKQADRVLNARRVLCDVTPLPVRPV